MKIKIDLKADALIRSQKGKFAKNKVIDEDTLVDFDKKGRLLGVEMLNITHRIPLKQLTDVNVKIHVIED
ncbi:MAG: DUF2283 domain-containing protein [Candidatus Aenigmarchaeota archaeon]|nr:DUF2283 domain-containing protein [Candidatus Aenigmarchaeota archaeon]